MCIKKEVNKLVLDFSDCATLEELYQHIKQKLGLPDWCGENLDALWDGVTGMMALPVEITVMGQPRDKELGLEMRRILALLYEAEETYGKIKVLAKE